jgi:hypothetical protein
MTSGLHRRTAARSRNRCPTLAEGAVEYLRRVLAGYPSMPTRPCVMRDKKCSFAGAARRT